MKPARTIPRLAWMLSQFNYELRHIFHSFCKRHFNPRVCVVAPALPWDICGQAQEAASAWLKRFIDGSNAHRGGHTPWHLELLPSAPPAGPTREGGLPGAEGQGPALQLQLQLV
jgi:hypothetical protein